jgi:hypothetical protein
MPFAITGARCNNDAITHDVVARNYGATASINNQMIRHLAITQIKKCPRSSSPPVIKKTKPNQVLLFGQALGPAQFEQFRPSNTIRFDGSVTTCR